MKSFYGPKRLKCEDGANVDSDARAQSVLKNKDAKEIDSRHPYYIGEWKRSVPGKDTGMAMDNMDEPHIKRKHAILAAHPQVTELYGVEPLTKYITVGLVAVQLVCSYLFGRVLSPQYFTEKFGVPGYWYWIAFASTVFLVGGSVTAMMGVIIHETSHCVCFKSVFMNRVLGYVANIPIPFPIAQSFRRYHLDHHAYQGIYDRDPDLPLDWELKFITGGNVFSKILWIALYPVMYVVRGIYHQKVPNKWEIINVFTTVSTDIAVYYYNGPIGLFYLFCSLWMGYSFHPGAAHFIQEHYTYVNGQETYSYYGWMNSWMMNIGYHNEHHDFTKIPWTKLPALRAMAPEFYDCLHAHTSWPGVILSFIFDSSLAPIARCVRSQADHVKGRKQVPSIVSALKSASENDIDASVKEDDVLIEGEDEMDRVEKEALKYIDKEGLKQRKNIKHSDSKLGFVDNVAAEVAAN